MGDFVEFGSIVCGSRVMPDVVLCINCKELIFEMCTRICMCIHENRNINSNVKTNVF